MPQVFNRNGFWMLYLIGAFLFAAFFAMVSPFGTSTWSAFIGVGIWTVSISAIIVALCLVIAIHELGHLYVVRRHRWHCIGVQILMLKWTWQQDRYRFSVDMNVRTAGMVLFTPTNATVDQHLKVAIAGPLLSLLGFIVFFGAGYAIAPALDPFFLKSLPAMVLKVLGYESLIIGVTSLLPVCKPGAYLSDGMVIWLYYFNPEALEAYCSVINLFVMSKEVRPSNYPPEVLEPKSKAPEYLAVLHLYRFWHFMDKADLTKAKSEILEAWERIDQMTYQRQYQATIAFETAMFFTRFDLDLELRDRAYAKGIEADKESETRHSADAAQLFVDGKTEEAKAILEQAFASTAPLVSEQLQNHIVDWNARILNPEIPTRLEEPHAPPKPLPSE